MFQEISKQSSKALLAIGLLIMATSMTVSMTGCFSAESRASRIMESIRKAIETDAPKAELDRLEEKLKAIGPDAIPVIDAEIKRFSGEMKDIKHDSLSEVIDKGKYLKVLFAVRGSLTLK